MLRACCDAKKEETLQSLRGVSLYSDGPGHPPVHNTVAKADRGLSAPEDLAPMNTLSLRMPATIPRAIQAWMGHKEHPAYGRYTELAPDRFCSPRIHQMHTAARGDSMRFIGLGIVVRIARGSSRRPALDRLRRRRAAVEKSLPLCVWDRGVDGDRIMVLGKARSAKEPVTLPEPTKAALEAWLQAQGTETVRSSSISTAPAKADASRAQQFISSSASFGRRPALPSVHTGFGILPLPRPRPHEITLLRCGSVAARCCEPKCLSLDER